MGQIRVVGTFPNIDPAILTEFKEAVAEAVAHAAGEEETLDYEYFMSPDETTCVVFETYASSDALLAHMAAAGPVLQRLFELGGEVRGDFFGDLSPALVEAVAPFHPGIYASIGGK